MSDLGDLGGEVVGRFIGIPMAIILIISTPFMMIDSCSKRNKKPISIPIEHKELLSFRVGQAVKQSSKDFVRGVFTKKEVQ